MKYSSPHATIRILGRGVVLATMALLLASCNATHKGTAAARSSALPITTADPLASSLCGSDEGDYVRQSFDGNYTACIRVPNFQSSSVVVALDADIFNTPLSSNPITTLLPSSHEKIVSLSLSPSTATPGETVVVTGRLAAPASQRQSAATLCWDGCNALQEEATRVRWLSSVTFRMKLRVPATAWIVSKRDSVSVHSLTSGKYEVGVQCLTAVSGCALGRAEAQASLQLKAPQPTRCVSGHRCETMSLSASTAMVGEEILVKGWAPVQDIIGRPFSFSLSLTSSRGKKDYPPFAFARLTKIGDFRVVLTPRTVRIEPSQSWASLGRVQYESSTYSGVSPIAPLNGSTLIAWCLPSGVDVTGGPSDVHVATLDVTSALKGSILRILGHPPVVPQCATVQLDPRFPDSVYAGFETAHYSEIPPVYLAPLYTTDNGVTWHRVPTPPGSSLEDFGGFTTEGGQVAALFTGPNSYSGNGSPVGTHNDSVSAEVTSDGGNSWRSTTLGCPTEGPCTTFGPYLWGNCAMNEQTQPLLVGSPSATALSGVKWSSSSWVTSVNSCFPQQLVVSSAHELFLLDPSSQYPFLESTDSGRTWIYRVLPSIAAANYGADSIPMSNSLVLAPDGSLFAVITSRSGVTQQLYRLEPSATSWCLIPHALGATNTTSDVVGPLRVNSNDLIWSQTLTASDGTSTTRMHLASLTSLDC